MISYLLAGAAGEPVSLAEAKAFLRVDADAEDGLVTTLVAAARLHIESVTGKAMLSQGWRLVLDGWPDTVTLPVGPLLELTEARLFDDADDEHAVPLEALTLVATEPPRLALDAAADLPAPRARLGFEIDYRAGYGETAADVPAPLKQALLGLVAHWYENRDAVLVAGSGAVIPSGFDRLLAPYRAVRL